MAKLGTLLHVIDAISEWSGKIVSFLVVLITGTIIYMVLTRYVFHTSTTWTYTTATKIFFVYIIFGAAYVLRLKANVNVDVLYNRLSLRARGVIDSITFIAFMLFCMALLYMAVVTVTMDAPKFHFSLRAFLPPSWPVTLVAPIGVFLFLLQGLAKFIRDLVQAVTGKELG